MTVLRLFAVRYCRWLVSGAWCLVLFGLVRHSHGLMALGMAIGLCVVSLMDRETLARAGSPYVAPEWQCALRTMRLVSIAGLLLIGLFAVMDRLHAWP